MSLKKWFRGTSIFLVTLFLSTALLGCGSSVNLEEKVQTPEEDALSTDLQVDFANVIQDNFLGVNATYHGFAFMPEQVDKGMNDIDRAQEFDRVKRAELKIARTWYSPDWACGSTIKNEFDWNSTKMNAFYDWLSEMKERNVDIALQSGWGIPDPTQDLERFAVWVSESLNQLISVKGFTNIKYLVLFTEPTLTQQFTVPEGDTLWTYYLKVINAINDRLITDGRRDLVKFVGPNNTHGGAHLTEATKDLGNVIDIYSGHDYNAKDYKTWFTMCMRMKGYIKNTNKDLWVDEYGMQDEAFRQTPEYGSYLAQSACAFINSGMQTSLMWILFDQQYVSFTNDNKNTTTNDDSFKNGVHRWGTTKWPHDDIENPNDPYPHWYAFSLLSKYMGGYNGAKVFKATDDDKVYIAALQIDDGYSFMVVNTNNEPKEFTVNLSKAIDKTLYKHLYDPKEIVVTQEAEIIKSSLTLDKIKKNITDTLPANSFAIYTSRAD